MLIFLTTLEKKKSSAIGDKLLRRFFGQNLSLIFFGHLGYIGQAE